MSRDTRRGNGGNWRRRSTLVALMAATACALTVGACGGGGDSGGNSQATQAPTAGQLSAMAQLGEKLFNDTALSASGKQSCATCHVDSRAFAGDDPLAVPLGGPNMDLPGLRNTPALAYNQFTPAFSIGADGKALAVSSVMAARRRWPTRPRSRSSRHLRWQTPRRKNCSGACSRGLTSMNSPRCLASVGAGRYRRTAQHRPGAGPVPEGRPRLSPVLQQVRRLPEAPQRSRRRS